MIIGIKSGTYSLFHAGHFWALNECKKQCDYLIALTNFDDYVLKKKGIVPLSLKERLYILSNHKAVNEVGWFSEFTEDDWIKNFKLNRLYQQFGHNAHLKVFHSEELKYAVALPGEESADEIVIIPKQSSPWVNSTTKIFNIIRGANA